MSKIYPYSTGNIELFERLNAGENLEDLMKEISEKWKPGNEYLWDEYDIESLIVGEKSEILVNNLIYNRIKKYRELRDNSIDIKGTDPMTYKPNNNDLIKIAIGIILTITIGFMIKKLYK